MRVPVPPARVRPVLQVLRVHQAQVQSQPQFPHQRAPRPYQNGGHPLQQHEGGKFMGKPSPKGPYSSKFPHGNNRPYDKHEKPYN